MALLKISRAVTNYRRRSRSRKIFPGYGMQGSVKRKKRMINTEKIRYISVKKYLRYSCATGTHLNYETCLQNRWESFYQNIYCANKIIISFV